MGKNTKLKVYYGWSKINAVRKKVSLSVVFENTLEARSERGQKTLSRIQETCYERFQDSKEMEQGSKQTRILTGYDMMFDDKHVDGSLNKILKANSEADKNHVSLTIRKEIEEALRTAFMRMYPDYKEPASQLELFE